ncbi:MAG: dephospho-CoA kinase [bacterium]|nr:dephospho-CoA kinase [bacterium]
MILVALTGGIGSGKSTLAPMVEALGWRIIDSDQLARKVVAKGSEGLEEVVDLLGPKILLPNGEMDRQRVAEIVFNELPLLRELEAITHRRIAHEKKRLLRQLFQQDPDARVCYLIPLLFEKNLQSRFAATILVALEPAEQVRRLVEGRGMNLVEIERRIQAQLPLEEKRARADYVVDNSGSLEETRQQVEAIFSQLSKLPQRDLKEVLYPS